LFFLFYAGYLEVDEVDEIVDDHIKDASARRMNKEEINEKDRTLLYFLCFTVYYYRKNFYKIIIRNKYIFLYISIPYIYILYIFILYMTKLIDKNVKSIVALFV